MSASVRDPGPEAIERILEDMEQLRMTPAEVARQARRIRAHIDALKTCWRPIETAPTDEMFIWAKPKGDGKWGLGLAYRNVSGGWSDAYGAPTGGATHWKPIGEPPSATNGDNVGVYFCKCWACGGMFGGGKYDVTCEECRLAFAERRRPAPPRKDIARKEGP